MSDLQGRRALILDGRDGDGDATLTSVHDALVDGLVAAGWAVDDWALRDADIAWCTGCFGCWVTTPGECAHKDAGHDVADRAEHADLWVFLTPVTFGGYSSQLKRALDHIIPILVPFLIKEDGETRHPLRYDHRQDLLALGVVPAGQAGSAQADTFRRLVERNTLNMRPPHWAAGVVERGTGDRELRVEVAGLLAEVGAAPAAGAPAPAAAEVEAPVTQEVMA
jgi:multimeric flavodoxin WrbA